MNTVIAIDPGASGGIALQTVFGDVIAIPMPDTEGDIFTELRKWSIVEAPLAIVEAQVGCVGPGIRVSSSAMFTFGRNYGFILGCLQSMGYRVELVRPQKWQKALGLGSRSGGDKTEWKNKLKSEAQRLFPGINVTLKTADALLLLEYGRRQKS